VGRHRRDADDIARADPTVVLPAVDPEDPEDPAEAVHRGERGGRTVSPLLLGAGGVALTLVLVVGGWALMGGRGDGNPLVYPWSSDTPGPIDVSISLEPTDLPSPSLSPSLSPSPSPRPTRSRSAGPSLSVSPSLESITGAMTATAMPINGWNGGYVAQFTVTNTGSTTARWKVEIDFAQPLRIDQVWNATIDVSTGTHVVFSADRDLPPGQNVGFGFRAFYDGRTPAVPVTCTIDGRTFTCAQA